MAELCILFLYLLNQIAGTKNTQNVFKATSNEHFMHEISNFFKNVDESSLMKYTYPNNARIIFLGCVFDDILLKTC